MDDLLRDFLTESTESLLRLDREIVELEKRPDDLELLKSIFRTIHTIKGTCGFLDLARLEAVAHAAEDVLGLLRDGELEATPAVVSDILAAVDVIREILVGLEEREAEPEGEVEAVIANLERWVAGHEPEPADERVRKLPPHILQALVADGAVRAPALARSTLRVDVDVLDRLMSLADELALARDQLVQLGEDDERSRYAMPLQRLDRVTTELQEVAMKTRVQPIGDAWAKLPRLVRDLCRIAGKKIELVMEGADTELDRQILQAIEDPLVHMIRNSADHGIEAPAARVAAGKVETGTIRLEAYHEGEEVVIEIRDDGKGLDAEAIRAKAVARGLVRPEVAAALPEARLFRYIFEPGFSTAAKVTNVSGRGVGMDVVRSNIEGIGGAVELGSVRGRGTTFRIRIPLSRAILPARPESRVQGPDRGLPRMRARQRPIPGV